MRVKEWILLILIVIVGFSARLYKIQNSIADWHSWRQADTSAVSRNFIKHGFDILHPTYDDISNVQSGIDNPKGYRFVEFPLFNIAQAGLFSIFGHFTLEEWGRLVTVFLTTVSIIFVFLLGKRFGNSTIGLIAAGFYALVPYSIYYGRVILPDPAVMTTLLAGIYFFDKATNRNEKIKIKNEKFDFQKVPYYILATIFTASSLLLKPFAGFFLLPFVYISWEKFGWKMFAKWQLWIFAIVSLLPLFLWRVWIVKFPEGIPASTWLLNQGNIRFTGAYFYWIFAQRISQLILGYYGIAIVICAFFNQKKQIGFFLSFVVSSLLYLIVFARGNVQHDYYQILILPTIAFLFGLGGDFLLTQVKAFGSKYTGVLVFGICSIFTLIFGWYQIRDYFNINNPAIISAGKAIDTLTPKDALIVAPYDGDTSLLYQTNRKGWPSFEKSLPELITMGADYLVFLHPTNNDKNLGHTYKIVVLTNDYILFDLHKKGM